MKKIIALTLLVAGISFNASAQKKDKKEIKELVEKVISLTESGKYAEVLDYTYPALFELVPKETLAAQLDEVFNSEELKITMNDFSMGEVGDIMKGETAQYSRIPYNYTMSMQFLSEETGKEVLDMTSGMLVAQFGEENVKIEEETKTIIIINESEMLAIKDNDAADWTIVELKSDQMEMMKMILPADIYEAVK